MAHTHRKIQPLTEKQLRDRANVVLAYADFWNHLKFRKGWATPLFTLNEAKPLLERAAEIVVRIRSALDKVDPTFKMRMVDGAAREYLWTVKKKPAECPERFVRDLVRATFSDGKGFVEGLTTDKIDEYIQQFDPALNIHELQVAEHHQEAVDKLSSAWVGVSAIMSELLSNQQQPSSLSEAASTEEERDLSKLFGQLTGLSELARGCLERSRKRRATSEQEPEHDAGKKSKKKKKNKHSKQQQQHEQEQQEQPAIVEEPEDTAASKPAEPEPQAMDASPSDAATPATADAQAASDATAPAEPMVQDGSAAEAPTESTGESPSEAAAQPTSEGIVEEPDEEAHSEDEDDHDESDEASTSDSTEIIKEKQENFTIRVQQVADEVDKMSKEITELNESVQSLDHGQLPTDPHQASALLRQLRGRCGQFTDSLLRDMTVLDSLSLAEEHRPVRKAQIQAIERLVDTVEDISRRIKEMQAHVQQKQDTTDKTAGSDRTSPSTTAPAPTQPASAPKTAKPAAESADERLASLWKQLRLQVRLDVEEAGNAYVLQGYVPGLKNEDIKVQLSQDGDALTVSGVRLPSANELALMRRQLRREGVETIENILRMGSGRYGSFSQQFRLPANADRDNISADYQNGVLRIVIPRRPVPQAFTAPRARRSPWGAGARYPGARSFMDDGDIWW